MLVTHLRAKVEISRRPLLKDRPVLVVDRNPSRARPIVVDRSPAAHRARGGMTLEQALSHHGNAVALDADEPLYRRVFGQMLAALQGVSDRVEGYDLGTAYVRLDGLDGLFRNEAGVASALLNAVPAYLTPRVGVANAKFPAYIAALTCQANGAFSIPADVSAFLAPHAVDLLPVSSDLKGDMHRFGLHTMGDVASMNRHALADRFGPEGLRAWSLSNGADNSPIVPLAFEEPVVERTSLPFHSSSIDALLVAVDALLKRAYARPDMQGRYAGSVGVLCMAPGWPVWERSIRFKQPLGASERAFAIVRYRLEADPPRFPVEDVTLSLSGVTGEYGVQMGLLRDTRDDAHGRLVEADRRLRGVMGGAHALHRIAEVAPWHPAPEMRDLLMPIDPSGREVMRPLHVPRPVEVREDAAGEPASLLIERRWRPVARIDDRWTFDLWWLPEPVSRAYYRIEHGDDRWMTLFRDQRDERWYRQSA